MWAVRELSTQLTNNQTDLWETCVPPSAFPGAHFVCDGSEEEEALIKGLAGYRDARLTAPGDKQPDGVQMRATRLDLFLQPVGARPITFSLPWASLWIYCGISGVSGEIKVTFSFKVFIDVWGNAEKRKLFTSCSTQITCTTQHWLKACFFLFVILCKYLTCAWMLCCVCGGGGGGTEGGVSGNQQDEVAVSCLTVINRCWSCYLPRPDRSLHHPPLSSVHFSRLVEFTYRSHTGSTVPQSTRQSFFSREQLRWRAVVSPKQRILAF